MAIELSGLIQADLAALAQDARSMQLSVAPAATAAAAPQFSFAQSMNDAFASVSADERIAAERMNAVDSGASDDLVGAMLSSQQASLSFSMLMQVRNKVMGAVDELLKLPV